MHRSLVYQYTALWYAKDAIFDDQCTALWYAKDAFFEDQ